MIIKIVSLAYMLALPLNIFSASALTGSQPSTGSQSLLEPADAFKLICRSTSPKISPASPEEPIIWLFKGPQGLRPVLFPNESNENGIPIELTDPLYKPTDRLLEGAKKTYNAYMGLAGNNHLQILRNVHQAACAQVLKLQEAVYTVIRYSEDGYANTHPDVIKASKKAALLAYKINPLEIVLLRELMMRLRPDITVTNVADIKTPVLNQIEFGMN